MKKFLLMFLLGTLLFSSVSSVFAQGTVLPQGDKSDTVEDCEAFMMSLEQGVETGQININKALACAVKTGNIELWMIPHFVIYMIEVVLGIAGLVSVLMMIVGGYQYVIGGLTEDKDKAKKTILFAIAGLVVSLLAWAIVNIVQLALTG